MLEIVQWSRGGMKKQQSFLHNELPNYLLMKAPWNSITPVLQKWQKLFEWHTVKITVNAILQNWISSFYVHKDERDFRWLQLWNGFISKCLKCWVFINSDMMSCPYLVEGAKKVKLACWHAILSVIPFMECSLFVQRCNKMINLQWVLFTQFSWLTGLVLVKRAIDTWNSSSFLDLINCADNVRL